MKRFFMIVILCCINVSYAAEKTIRIPEFSNEKVKVWKSIIYPTRQEQLVMHRHDHDRVVVALDDGVLKIVNSEQHVHFLTFKQGKAYFLPKDPKGMMHTDENVGQHVLRVMVIELLG